MSKPTKTRRKRVPRPPEISPVVARAFVRQVASMKVNGEERAAKSLENLVFAAQQIVQNPTHQYRRKAEVDPNDPRLTARQREVIAEYQAGASCSEVAKKFRIATGTAKIHIRDARKRAGGASK